MSQPPRAEGEKAKDRWADLPQVDVEKMDYEYVGKCEDAKELLLVQLHRAKIVQIPKLLHVVQHEPIHFVRR